MNCPQFGLPNFYEAKGIVTERNTATVPLLTQNIYDLTKMQEHKKKKYKNQGNGVELISIQIPA